MQIREVQLVYKQHLGEIFQQTKPIFVPPFSCNSEAPEQSSRQAHCKAGTAAGKSGRRRAHPALLNP